MVYIFFHFTEAFHYRQATASSIAKILLEKIIFTWGILLKLHSDNSVHGSSVLPTVLPGQFYNTFTVLTPLDPQC